MKKKILENAVSKDDSGINYGNYTKSNASSSVLSNLHSSNTKKKKKDLNKQQSQKLDARDFSEQHQVVAESDIVNALFSILLQKYHGKQGAVLNQPTAAHNIPTVASTVGSASSSIDPTLSFMPHPPAYPNPYRAADAAPENIDALLAKNQRSRVNRKGLVIKGLRGKVKEEKMVPEQYRHSLIAGNLAEGGNVNVAFAGSSTFTGNKFLKGSVGVDGKRIESNVMMTLSGGRDYGLGSDLRKGVNFSNNTLVASDLIVDQLDDKASIVNSNLANASVRINARNGLVQEATITGDVMGAINNKKSCNVTINVQGGRFSRQSRLVNPQMHNAELALDLTNGSRVYSLQANDAKIDNVKFSTNSRAFDVKLNGAKGKNLQVNGCKMFRLVDLSGSDLGNGKLSFNKSSADGASLTNMELQGDVVFDNCKMAGAKLDGAKISNASFRHANLIGANLSGVTIEGDTVPYGINLSKMDLSKLEYKGKLGEVFDKLKGKNFDEFNAKNKEGRLDILNDIAEELGLITGIQHSVDGPEKDMNVEQEKSKVEDTQEVVEQNVDKENVNELEEDGHKKENTVENNIENDEQRGIDLESLRGMDKQLEKDEPLKTAPTNFKGGVDFINEVHVADGVSFGADLGKGVEQAFGQLSGMGGVHKQVREYGQVKDQKQNKESLNKELEGIGKLLADAGVKVQDENMKPSFVANAMLTKELNQSQENSR